MKTPIRTGLAAVAVCGSLAGPVSAHMYVHEGTEGQIPNSEGIPTFTDG